MSSTLTAIQKEEPKRPWYRPQLLPRRPCLSTSTHRMTSKPALTKMPMGHVSSCSSRWAAEESMPCALQRTSVRDRMMTRKATRRSQGWALGAALCYNHGAVAGHCFCYAHLLMEGVCVVAQLALPRLAHCC
jgi:hypothetical protein